VWAALVNKMPYVTKNCLVCKNIFRFKNCYSNSLRNLIGKYCSRKCYWTYQKLNSKGPKRVSVNSGRIGRGKQTMETRIKISKALFKKDKKEWTGFVKSTYLVFRQSVLNRDNHACITCGSKERLEIDHIKPVSLFPKQKFCMENVRTLCRKCHISTDTYGQKLFDKYKIKKGKEYKKIVLE
jgi:hypothetical protein